MDNIQNFIPARAEDVLHLTLEKTYRIALSILDRFDRFQYDALFISFFSIPDDASDKIKIETIQKKFADYSKEAYSEIFFIRKKQPRQGIERAIVLLKSVVIIKQIALKNTPLNKMQSVELPLNAIDDSLLERF